VLHADSEGRVVAHDYDLRELRQVLVPFSLHEVHHPAVGLVGEFRNVAGHSIFVGLRPLEIAGIGARLVKAAGGGRGPVVALNDADAEPSIRP
ncbi:MAG TPA: hypothetical protein QGF05_01295, partial [Dehalococcoidia bacterium]|nr:hypothetical protein [Dehalococcoidia bacterium]